MSRYVDADAIKRELRVWATNLGNPKWFGKDEAEIVIDFAPSIDIVRCKECKHNYNKVINHGKMQPRCDFTDRALTENDFCSRGEREVE